MNNHISKIDTHNILDQMMAELSDHFKVFFKIHDTELDLYTPNPGVVIGPAGTRINKYESLLKEIGISKVNIIDVTDARIPKYDYTDEIFDQL